MYAKKRLKLSSGALEYRISSMTNAMELIRKKDFSNRTVSDNESLFTSIEMSIRMDNITTLIWSIVGALIAILNSFCLIFLFRHRTSLLVKSIFQHLVAVCACDIFVGITLTVETSPIAAQFKENIYFCVGSLMFFCMAQILSHTSVFGLILRRYIVIRNLHTLSPSYGWNKRYIFVMLATSLSVIATSCGAFIYLLPPVNEIFEHECVISVIYKNNARKVYGVMFFWLTIFLLSSNLICFLCIKRLKWEIKTRFKTKKKAHRTKSLETLCLAEYLTPTSSAVNNNVFNQELRTFKDGRVLKNILKPIPLVEKHIMDCIENSDQRVSTITSSTGSLTSPHERNTHIPGVDRNQSFCKALASDRNKFDTTSSRVHCDDNSYGMNAALLDASSSNEESENQDMSEKEGTQTTSYTLTNVNKDHVTSEECTENLKKQKYSYTELPQEVVDKVGNEGQLGTFSQRTSRVLTSSRPFLAKAEKKALVTLSVVVILLNLSTAPTIILVVIMALGGDISYNTRAIVGNSMCLNSFFNTMIYVMRIHSLRECICAWRRVKIVEEVDASTQT